MSLSPAQAEMIKKRTEILKQNNTTDLAVINKLFKAAGIKAVRSNSHLNTLRWKAGVTLADGNKKKAPEMVSKPAGKLKMGPDKPVISAVPKELLNILKAANKELEPYGIKVTKFSLARLPGELPDVEMP